MTRSCCRCDDESLCRDTGLAVVLHPGGDRGGNRGVEVRRGHHDDVEVEKLVEAAVAAGVVVHCGGEPKTRCTA